MLGGAVFQPGEILAGKYRIDRVLGQGGMGVVLAGRHLDLDFDVAIKVLLPTALGNDEAVERFMREGKASAKLTTPHVAKVYDVGRLPNQMPFLVMELLRGKDLKELIEAQGAQPLADVVRWTLEAGEALSEAHSLGIVHRDVKPANLFLTDMPNGRTLVKLLDFGISKKLDAAIDLTRTSASMGSPLYMAPEQVQSSKHVDPRVDIWALGVVMYELSTGRGPFDGSNLPEVVAAILQKTPLPPSHHVPGIPSSFDEIVMRCLDKRPEHRFQTVAELARALHVWQRRSPDAPPGDPSFAAPLIASTAFPQSMPGHQSAAGSTPMLHLNTTGRMATPLGATPAAANTGPHGVTNRAWESAYGAGAVPKRPSRAPLVGGLALLVFIAGVVGATRPWQWIQTRSVSTSAPNGRTADEADRALATASSVPRPSIEGGTSASSSARPDASAEPSAQGDRAMPSSPEKKPTQPTAPKALPKSPVASSHPAVPPVPAQPPLPPPSATARPRMY